MAEKSTEGKIRDCNKALGKEGSCSIINDLHSLKHALEQMPTKKEIKAMLSQVADDGNENTDLSEFLSCKAQPMTKDEESVEALIDAFRVFDREGKGYILADKLRHVLTTLGEWSVAEEEILKVEVDELLKDPQVNVDGRIDYKALATMMLE